MGVLLLRVSVALLFGFGFFTGGGLGQFPSTMWRRPATEIKEGVCLGYAVKYFNITIGFHEKLHMSSTPYFYDEVIHKEVPQLLQAIHVMDQKVQNFTKHVKIWAKSNAGTGKGGELLHGLFQRFIEEFKREHQALWNKHWNSNITKLSEAKQRLKSAKLSLVKAINEFIDVGKNYTDCAPGLLGAGIPLSRDRPARVRNSKVMIFPFDVSVLAELEAYYTDVGHIEDQVSLITAKYYGDDSKENIIPDPKDVITLYRGHGRMLVLDTEIKRIITKNEGMLRQFNEIVQVTLNKFPAQLKEISRSLDQTAKELLEAEREIAEADARINALLYHSKSYHDMVVHLG